ncbi:MAG: 3-isopropylmalate dehydratase small subunit [Rhodospirillales bacterium]|nr:3-isopropylmalate dehydratase small subunit [Rhodospirillales bacterium]MCB9995970.1 3-isopropylmalate dehydratase small subunit [Rhodospirillales bacterium]
MQKFTTLTAIAAPLPLRNIDTDMIIPKQFLRSIKRTGFGVNLFNDMRYNEDGSEIADFVLNKEPYRTAEILVAGDNFGCGSSREHAPWALLDFGIRCVIAPSFADIFYNNCFKNGILPVKLAQDAVDRLMQDAEAQHEITVDLEQQKIRSANIEYDFEIDPFRRECLRSGLDDIGLTLEKENEISAFEQKRKEERVWL